MLILRKTTRIGQSVRCASHGRTAIRCQLSASPDHNERYALECGCTRQFRPAGMAVLRTVPCFKCGTKTPTTNHPAIPVCCVACNRLAVSA